MIVLGVETATELVGVSVADDSGPVAAAWATGRRRHAESLAPAITHVLDQAGMTVGDVEAIAVDVGPGLFTGLRVGVATAKGLAQGLGIGVVACTSVQVLAAAAAGAGWSGPVLAVVDARRKEVFAARYLVGPAAVGSAAVGSAAVGTGPAIRELSPPERFTPEGLAAELAAGELAAAQPVNAAGPGAGGPGAGGPGWLAVGDGARRYADVLGGVPGLRVAGPVSPPPDVLAGLAVRLLAGGAPAQAPEEVQPVYLREADVQINWAQRGRG